MRTQNSQLKIVLLQATWAPKRRQIVIVYVRTRLRCKVFFVQGLNQFRNSPRTPELVAAWRFAHLSQLYLRGRNVIYQPRGWGLRAFALLRDRVFIADALRRQVRSLQIWEIPIICRAFAIWIRPRRVCTSIFCLGLLKQDIILKIFLEEIVEHRCLASCVLQFFLQVLDFALLLDHQILICFHFFHQADKVKLRKLNKFSRQIYGWVTRIQLLVKHECVLLQQLPTVRAIV